MKKQKLTIIGGGILSMSVLERMNQEEVKNRKIHLTEKTETFEEYIKKERINFVNTINSQEWNTEMRLAAENLLIAYDQLFDKIPGEKEVVLPMKLTAENGAKGLLSREFFVEYEVNDFPYKQPVPWTTIKDIYFTIVKHFGKTNPPQTSSESEK